MTGFRNALLSAAGAAGGGYSVDNSILGDGTSDYLKRTIGTTGSTQTATFSFWYKPCGLGTNRYLYSSGNDAGGDAADYFSIIFNTSDKFAFDMRIGGVDEVQLITTRVFRDSHAWYHLVVNIDITNATAADRVRVYVNGVRETNWATNTNNLNGTENSVMFTAGEEQYVGSWYYDQTNPFDGYFSEFVCIDGSALDPTSFGEYDLNGVWRPINVSGLTFGTNGFYLDFAASGDLGNDVSGNANDFTPSGAPTQTSDTPTDNYCTWSPLDIDSNFTLSNGNLTEAASANNEYFLGSSMAFDSESSAGFYFEFDLESAPTSTNAAIGVAQIDFDRIDHDANPHSHAETWSIDMYDGGKANGGGSYSTYGAAVSNGSTVQVFVQSGNIYFGVNDNWANGTGAFNQTFANKVAAYSNLTGDVKPFRAHGGFGVNGTLNCGQLGFTYTEPTGAYRIRTSDLYTNAAPAIEDGTAHFQATAYEGNGGTPQNIDQSGNSTFQPDFVWIKNRDAVYQHKLLDAIRGVGQELYSNQTDAETTDTNGLTSFDNDGFGLGTDNGGYNSANSFVAWQWKGDGTSGASNTNGTITSTVNVNDTAGFSIGKYVGSGSNGATVGHGLSAAPEFIIVKNRDQADGWVIYHPTPSATDELRFNNLAASPNSAFWNNTEPTSTVFSVGTSHGTNASTENYIFYAWRSIPGYSSFGTYEGNGNSNGAMLLFDFSPAYIMFKNIDASAQWAIYDNQRDPYNAADKMLFADSSGTENVGNVIDWLANGVKIRGTSAAYNASNTYIYFAFAEHPFAGSSPATAR